MARISPSVAFLYDALGEAWDTEPILGPDQPIYALIQQAVMEGEVGDLLAGPELTFAVLLEEVDSPGGAGTVIRKEPDGERKPDTTTMRASLEPYVGRPIEGFQFHWNSDRTLVFDSDGKRHPADSFDPELGRIWRVAGDGGWEYQESGSREWRRYGESADSPEFGRVAVPDAGVEADAAAESGPEQRLKEVASRIGDEILAPIIREFQESWPEGAALLTPDQLTELALNAVVQVINPQENKNQR